MAETVIIPLRTKLTVPRPRISAETKSTEKLTVDFTAKKSSPSSGKLTVSADSYNAILEEMHPAHNQGAGIENRLRNNKAPELADAQEIVRRVGGRPSSHGHDKTHRKGKRGQESSSEEDRAVQKRRAQARGESEKISKEDEEETELGRLEFARTLRNDPAKLAHLLRVLPPRDYRQLEARLVYWEKFEERKKNLAPLAQKAETARAVAQQQWDSARKLLAASLTLGIMPKKYSLGDMAETLRQVINAAKHSRERDNELMHARRVHLATTFEEPSADLEPARPPEKTDREKNPLFGFAVRLDTATEKIAQKLLRVTRK